MKIYLENQQKKLPLNPARIKKIVRKVLIEEGKSPALRSFRKRDMAKSGVNIIFTDNLKIARLNKKYLNRRGPTDVLAFPMQEGLKIKGNPYFLGDIVISAEMARAKARQFNIDPRKEICLYVIHGLLHLLGYDHKKGKDDLVMRQKEKEYLFLCRAKNGG